MRLDVYLIHLRALHNFMARWPWIYGRWDQLRQTWLPTPWRPNWRIGSNDITTLRQSLKQPRHRAATAEQVLRLLVVQTGRVVRVRARNTRKEGAPRIDRTAYQDHRAVRW
jgi:hypothetical protein